MSRIGKKLINIPDKVSVQVQDASIEVKGPLGVLAKKIPQGITLEVKGKEIHVLDSAALPQSHALHGLMRTLIANMVQGVVEPWKKDLEIQGVGYRAAKQGQVLNLALGFSHPINFNVPPTVQFNVDAKQTLITMSCPDKELLGVIAAKIRSFRPPEPYKGKG